MAMPTTKTEDGPWIVVNMDGSELSRHGTEQAALDWIDGHQRQFARRRTNSGGLTQAYLPMSAIHEPCGKVRNSRYSTGWHSPGCTHTQAAREKAGPHCPKCGEYVRGHAYCPNPLCVEAL